VRDVYISVTVDLVCYLTTLRGLQKLYSGDRNAGIRKKMRPKYNSYILCLAYHLKMSRFCSSKKFENKQQKCGRNSDASTILRQDGLSAREL
jgi:hypothetical protein